MGSAVGDTSAFDNYCRSLISVDYLVKEAHSVEEIQSLYNQGTSPGFEVIGILRSLRFNYALAFYKVMATK